MRRSRRRGTAPPVATPEPGPTPQVREVDDLQTFFDRPPGSPAALTAGDSTTVDPPVVDRPADPPAPPPTGDRPRAVLLAVAVVVGVLVIGAVAFALVSAVRDPEAPRPTTPSTTTAPATTTTAAPLTASAAGDLADVDVTPGDTGLSASVSAGGVVLEPQAVGVTVAYPQLTVSTDGAQAVAHLELAVWNCLSDGAPADPAAADCRRTLTEYADLGSPDLQVTRTDAGLQLRGTVATYTRPNGSPAAYTGRSYLLDVDVEDAAGGATGTLALGDGRAALVPPSEVTG